MISDMNIGRCWRKALASKMIQVNPNEIFDDEEESEEEEQNDDDPGIERSKTRKNQLPLASQEFCVLTK